MSTLRVNNMTNVGGSGPTYASGMAIQTIRNVYTGTVYTTTTGSYTNTGLSATITPKSANSKILVIVQCTIQMNNVDVGYVTLFRGAFGETNLAGSSNYFTTQYSAGNTSRSGHSLVTLDAPNTTSAVTYTLGIKPSAAQLIYSNPNNEFSSITLMEIAA